MVAWWEQQGFARLHSSCGRLWPKWHSISRRWRHLNNEAINIMIIRWYPHFAKLFSMSLCKRLLSTVSWHWPEGFLLCFKHPSACTSHCSCKYVALPFLPFYQTSTTVYTKSVYCMYSTPVWSRLMYTGLDMFSKRLQNCEHAEPLSHGHVMGREDIKHSDKEPQLGCRWALFILMSQVRKEVNNSTQQEIGGRSLSTWFEQMMAETEGLWVRK